RPRLNRYVRLSPSSLRTWSWSKDVAVAVAVAVAAAQRLAISSSRDGYKMYESHNEADTSVGPNDVPPGSSRVPNVRPTRGETSTRPNPTPSGTSVGSRKKDEIGSLTPVVRAGALGSQT